MDAIEAIKGSLDLSELVCMSYLSDLSDQELMQRPHPQCHHLNWQIGHLISSEHAMLKGIAPEAAVELPAGMSEKYTKETAGSDEASQFASKEELLQAYRSQRDATLRVLAESNANDLDAPSGIDYAPTKGAVLRMQAEHWLMHCGQWVVVRRHNNKPIVI